MRMTPACDAPEECCDIHGIDYNQMLEENMKVKELIEELKYYNPEADVAVGGNLDNGIHISYCSSDGKIKSDAYFVCFCEEVSINDEG